MSIIKTLLWVVKETERKEENWLLMWWGLDSLRKKESKGQSQMLEKRRGGEGSNCLRECRAREHRRSSLWD